MLFEFFFLNVGNDKHLQFQSNCCLWPLNLCSIEQHIYVSSRIIAVLHPGFSVVFCEKFHKSLPLICPHTTLTLDKWGVISTYINSDEFELGQRSPVMVINFSIISSFNHIDTFMFPDKSFYWVISREYKVLRLWDSTLPDLSKLACGSRIALLSDVPHWLVTLQLTICGLVCLDMLVFMQ